jgi:LysM repeat protein/ribosomal protein S27E
MKNWLDRYDNGGGLLSRTVTCSNCGWSWKATDGGSDPMTCHKCGGTIKMSNGGDISITDLEAGNWLDRYEVAGQVTNTTTKSPYVFPSYQMPRQANDSNSGLDRNKQIAINVANNAANQTDALVNNFKKANPWAANLSYNDIVSRANMQSQQLASQKQMTIKKASPAQSKGSKAWEIASHPMTALKYAVHNQDIPDNFSKGENNPLDYAASVFNPATYINAGVNVAKEVIPSLSPITNKPGIFNTLTKAGINGLTNLVDGTNVYNDGSNEKAINFLGDALTVLPMATELRPMLGKTLGNINNAIQTKPFLKGIAEEPGMVTARSSFVPELNWNRAALAAERAKPKPNTSLFGETFDNPKLSQREFIKTVEGPSGMKHDVGYQNYPSQQGYDFQRSFGMQGQDPSKGYLKFDLWKEKGNEYPEMGDFSFFNPNKVSASDHIKMMMGNLPKKVYMPPAGDEKLFSMYSQPIVNANVSRLAGNPQRITIKPTGKNSILNTGYLENTDQNFLQQAAEQFPRIQNSYKTLSKYTGTNLPEPKMYVDNKLATAEDLLSPELQKRIADSKFNYVKPDVFRIEVPDYDVHKHFKTGGWLDGYANGGGFLMPAEQGGMIDPILKFDEGGENDYKTLPEVKVYAKSNHNKYVVKPGDNLTTISKKTGISIKQLAELNKIADPNKIKINQVLALPNVQQAKPTAPAKMVIPGITDFKMPRNVSESTSIPRTNFEIVQNLKSNKPAPKPVSLNPRVAAQRDIIQNAGKENKNYAIVDKAADSVFYFKPTGENITGEPIITGASKNDTDYGLSMKDWFAKTGSDSHEDYFNYLKNNKFQTTPSGIFHVGQVRHDVATNPDVYGRVFNSLFRPEREKEIHDSRIRDYGPQQTLLTLISENGVPQSKAIHGTGNTTRIDAFNTPGADRSLSNGCINVNGKTVCFDELGTGSGVFVLPQESDDLLNYNTNKTSAATNKNYVKTRKDVANALVERGLPVDKNTVNFISSVAEKETKNMRSLGAKAEKAIPYFSKGIGAFQIHPDLFKQYLPSDYIDGDFNTGTEAVYNFYNANNNNGEATPANMYKKYSGDKKGKYTPVFNQIANTMEKTYKKGGQTNNWLNKYL